MSGITFELETWKRSYRGNFCLYPPNIKITYSISNRALDEREKFEKEATLAGEELEKLKTDDQDVIKYLQRTLQSRDDHCRELTERLKGMQLVRVVQTTKV